MATTSMHKPGWRSRRRSRLSLVERAVPRLGRMPGDDDGVKVPRPTDTKLPLPSSGPPARIAAREKAAEDRTKPESRKGGPATDGPAEIPEAAPGRPHGDGETASPAEAAGVAPKAGETDAAADEPLARRELPDDTPETAADDGAAARVGLAEPGPDVDSYSDRIEAGISSFKESAAPAEGAMLALDWDRLVERGFTDPRDRSRPLPENMDEIVRALIRQALSDQSSWRDRVILVTSPCERESKTAASINFAFGLTTVADHHAVLVDVDTGGAGAVDRLGGGDRPGVAAALADEHAGLGGLAIRTDLERLTLVACGDADDDILDRFASRRMLEIMRHLTENPDTILVIDAPPILVSQEAAVLSVIAGQVVMAVEAGRTTADQIEHALQRIGDRHNVSLVLSESSGLAGEAASAAGRRSPKSGSGKPNTTRRRAPKAALLAACAAVIGLLLQGDALAGPQAVLHSPEPAHSATGMAPPERWSTQIDALQRACRQDRR